MGENDIGGSRVPKRVAPAGWPHKMKIVIALFLGLILGVLLGAGLGVAIGLAWVNIFETSSFEGQSGMLVFFAFMPIGAIIGGIVGAILFGRMGGRSARSPSVLGARQPRSLRLRSVLEQTRHPVGNRVPTAHVGLHQPIDH
jgi:hypothetical protein